MSSSDPQYLLPFIVFIGIVYGMEYFFADTPIPGRVRSGEYPFAVEVFEEAGGGVPCGIGLEVGQTADGLATWKLKVRGADVSGRFIIDNGRFVPVPFDQPDPSRGSARRIRADRGEQATELLDDSLQPSRPVMHLVIDEPNRRQPIELGPAPALVR